MTREEVYEAYREWMQGEANFSIEDFFRMSVANRDVFENEMLVINHLYFLFLKYDTTNMKHFIFYEANTFLKDDAGDLTLIYSTYHVTIKE